MATHSSTLAWEIPWTEDPGGLKFIRSQTVRHNLATKQQQQRPVFHGNSAEQNTYFPLLTAKETDAQWFSNFQTQNWIKAVWFKKM